LYYKSKSSSVGEGDCIGQSVDLDEPKEAFGSSRSTECPIQSRIQYLAVSVSTTLAPSKLATMPDNPHPAPNSMTRFCDKKCGFFLS
jgi:hypothetical protein